MSSSRSLPTRHASTTFRSALDSRRLWALTVVDAFIREALAIDVDQGIKGERVVEVMARTSLIRGAPRTIRVDNAPEFISKALGRWAYENGVTLDFSRPGKALLSLSKGPPTMHL